ncbi:YceI family protein [Agriterribacter sp.]|uniref:YceI family protein n=1 Tax=Agriterribacter sp. TaxID=2821509 RepID=UPI002CBF7828|nr:YceI family protein [Agriterribacter sp.]HTN06987.1 YceI family protein [Agriterribacter sp.]
MKKVFFFFSVAALAVSCVSNPEGDKAETKDAVATGVAEGDKLAVDPAGSSITWLGKKVTGQHTGTINLHSGELIVSEGKLAGGSFTIDMATLNNKDLTDPEYKGKLETHLKSDDFFAVEKYPTSKFEITEVKHLDNGKIAVAGNLTLRDATKNITYEADIIESSATKFAAKADFNINRKDWGVAYEGMKDDLISDEINLKINLVAIK